MTAAFLRIGVEERDAWLLETVDLWLDIHERDKDLSNTRKYMDGTRSIQKLSKSICRAGRLIGF